jgi:hypothetical protein
VWSGRLPGFSDDTLHALDFALGDKQSLKAQRAWKRSASSR